MFANVFFFPAPSSPPTNATGEVLSPTIIFISWSPPVSGGQNGIIVSYHVKLLEVSSGMYYMYHRSSSHTEILITGLHPYYDYNCSVSAETSAGQGPYSVPLTIRTHEDGKWTIFMHNLGITMYIQCNNI